MTAPDAGMFDDWYAMITASPNWDPFVRRHLDLAPEIESTGYLSGPGLVEVQQRLALAPGETLVELGCGRAGYGLACISDTGSRLVGVDFSGAALAAARAAAVRLGLGDRAEFRRADLARTGLPGGSADAILSVDAFHFTPSVEAAAAEAHRLLRPGGRLVLTSWQAADSACDQRLPDRIRRLDLHRDLTTAGLAAVEVLDRPSWGRREADLWTAAAQLDPGGDHALASLREDAMQLLPMIPALRRVMVVARR